MARKPDPKKKNNIIIAAITEFARNGYAGTRIAAVAQAAGIGKGTIYEYFRSKEDLFFATFEHLMSDAGRQMAEIGASPSGSASSRLSAMADALIQEWMDQLELYGLVLEFWSATTALPGRQRFKAAFQSGYSGFRRIVTTVIQDGVADGEFRSDSDAEKIASALIGSWDALLFQAWLDPDIDPLQTSQEHMKVLVSGLRHPSKSEA